MLWPVQDLYLRDLSDKKMVSAFSKKLIYQYILLNWIKRIANQTRLLDEYADFLGIVNGAAKVSYELVTK